MGKFTKMSHNQVFEVGTVIRAHCHLQEGYAVYDDVGWSDEIIANQFGLKRGVISSLRLKSVGPFRKVAPPPVDLYAVLEARVTRIEKELGLVGQ